MTSKTTTDDRQGPTAHPHPHYSLHAESFVSVRATWG